jgi:hypothetical protein
MDKVIRVLGARWFQFAAIPFAVFIWFWLTDPSGGADTMMRVQLWGQAFLVTGLAYLIAKAMMGKASSEALYEEAMKGNQGAGTAYLGVCLLRSLVLLALLVFFGMVQG